MTKAWEVLGLSIASLGFEEFFYIMGGPMIDAAASVIAHGVRGVDVRHETAAVMMAHAAARRRAEPTLCMAASGPGAANLAPGLANALVDAAPVIAIAGASPVAGSHRGGFQEFDQFGLLSSVTKHAERILEPDRIQERLERALQLSMSGRPGPVYLEIPADVLYASVEGTPRRPALTTARPFPAGGPAEPSPECIQQVLALLRDADRPLIVVGSGVLWSHGEQALRRFAERVGVPVYTTPQMRGILPEDHELSFPGARSKACREADLLIVIGTRMNYIWSHFDEQRFAAAPRLVQIDTDADEIASSRPVDVGLIADPRVTLERLAAAASADDDYATRYSTWRTELREKHTQKLNDLRDQSADRTESPEGVHPARLCELLAHSLGREDILVTDGQDILAYARQLIPAYTPGSMLNSGVFGTMGVGLPYAIGAKIAAPHSRVVVLSGDGALGFSLAELDTAARHDVPITVVVSLNGGHTSDPEGKKPGRDLGYTRYHDIAAALGWSAEYVADEEALEQALHSAAQATGPVLINVRTLRTTPSRTPFTNYET